MITIPPPSARPGKPDRQPIQETIAQAGLNLPDAAVLAMQQGRLIEAIKRIRAANPGLDLARAKAVVDRLHAQARTAVAEAAPPLDAARSIRHARPQRPPTVAMGDPPGQLRWLLLVAAALVAAAWIVFDGVA